MNLYIALIGVYMGYQKYKYFERYEILAALKVTGRPIKYFSWKLSTYVVDFKYFSWATHKDGKMERWEGINTYLSYV